MARSAAAPCIRAPYFYISDGTGITAETFGNAILAQFEMASRAMCACPLWTRWTRLIRPCARSTTWPRRRGRKPIIFTTLVDMEVLKVIQDGCKGMLMDMFGTFVRPLEEELGIKSPAPRWALCRT